MKEKLKEIVKSNIRLSPQTKSIKPYIKEINKQTNFLPSKSRIPERIFCIINGIETQEKCICGNNLKFNSKEFKYEKYCCVDCIIKNTNNTNKDELLKLISNTIENKKPFKKESYAEYINFINQETSWMNKNDSLYARCFCISNNINKYPTCECGKEITVFNANCTHDFNEFCSKLCASKSQKVSERMVETKKKNGFYDEIKEKRKSKLYNIVNDESIKISSYKEFKNQFIKLAEDNNFDFPNFKNILFKNKEICKTYELKFKKYSYSRVYFHLKNGLKKIPKCSVCGKENQNFLSHTKGYSGFCSRSCGSKYTNINKNKKFTDNKSNISNISDEKLKELIFNQIDNYVSNNFYDIIQSKLPYLIGDIFKRTDYLNNDVRFNERLYHIINNLYSIPICSECKDNKKLKFNTFSKGYIKYCVKCSDKISGIKTGISLAISLRKRIYQGHVNELIENNYKCLTTKEEFIETGILEIKHLDCGKIHKRRCAYLNGCPFCSKKGRSDMEDKVFKFVEKHIDEEIIANSKPLKYYKKGATTITSLEIDIYVPSLNFGIEFDGLYYHSELSNGKTKNFHNKKTKLAEDINIFLIHIFENEWMLKREIVKSVILSKLGKYEKRVYARKCEIKEIDAKMKNKFLDENHLQGQDKSKHKIGLFYEKKLISVMTFGKRKITGGKVQTELIRFCNKLNTQIVGGASKLFSYYLKNLHDGSKIISYADRRYSNGNLYHQLGFKLKHISAPNYWYFHNKDKFNLLHRVNFQKHKLKDKLEIFDINLTEWENMINNNYDRIWDCGNFVFEYD